MISHVHIIIWISIHAPTRGATNRSACFESYSFISIHAPTRGATLMQLLNRRQDVNFNPRSHERSDETLSEVISKVKVFQSTLPREERR